MTTKGRSIQATLEMHYRRYGCLPTLVGNYQNKPTWTKVVPRTFWNNYWQRVYNRANFTRFR